VQLKVCSFVSNCPRQLHPCFDQQQNAPHGICHCLYSLTEVVILVLLLTQCVLLLDDRNLEKA
jgi:hypothetical protein